MNSVGTVLLSIIMSSIFIVIIMLFRKLCRNKISMRLQYALWLLVALRLLVFPIPRVESDLSWMQYLQRYEEVMTQKVTQIKIPYLSEVTTVSATVSTTALSEENQETVEQTSQSPQQVVKRSWEVSSVPLLWAIGEIIRLGWLVMFVFFVGYNIMFARYLHKNRMPYEGCMARLKVYLVEHLPSPCLYGKSIYITPDVTTDEKKLQHVIAHEQGHFRQGDMLWSVVRCLCLIIYWWNPLVWIAAHLSKQDCELSCDEIAIKTLGEEERIPYGETLLSLVCVKTRAKDFISISTTMTGSSKSMKQRIQRIAKQTQMVWWIAVLLICVCGFCFFGVSTRASARSLQVVAESTEAICLSDIAGEYYVSSKEYVFQPKLSLQEDETFTFVYDPLSSYLSYGTYRVETQQLVAETMDGKYHYAFERRQDGTLVFLPEQSSKIQLIDEEHSPTPPIEEWGAFQKE